MSLHPYPAYSETGIGWLGNVPSHWSALPLKHLVATPITDGPHETPAFLDSGVPFVSAEAVSSGRVDFSKIRGFISEQDHRRFSQKYIPQRNDIFVVKSGATTGVSAIVETDQEFNIWSPLAAIRCGEDINPRFLLHYLRSRNFLEAVTLFWSFGTQQNLGMGVLQNLHVALPSLAEQEAIAAYLDRETAKIDALVEEQKRLIELLKEKRQAVISHAVTKGLNPDAKMKDSGIEWLGKVPEHWEVLRIGNILREISEQGSDDLPILSVSIHDGVSDKELDPDELDRKVTRSEDRSKYKSVRPGDLVYNMMRAWQGGFGTVRTDGMVSPAYVVARPVTELETSFIENLLRTPNAVEEMRGRSRGVTDFRLRLYWDEFKNIRLALPPRAEQAKIIARISAFEEDAQRLSETAKGLIALLQERRSALISAAVTGKIHVSGLTEIGDAA